MALLVALIDKKRQGFLNREADSGNSNLFDWGSKGRWFESSRPDCEKALRCNKLRRKAFFLA